MSKSKPLVEIPPEIEAEMTPSVKAFVLAAFAKFEERISAFEEQVEKLTPRNSSMPPAPSILTPNRSRSESPVKSESRADRTDTSDISES